jgi:hypothetical protein
VALVPAIVAVFWPDLRIEAAGAAGIVVLLALNRMALARAPAAAP